MCRAALALLALVASARTAKIVVNLPPCSFNCFEAAAMQEPDFQGLVASCIQGECNANDNQGAIRLGTSCVPSLTDRRTSPCPVEHLDRYRSPPFLPANPASDKPATSPQTDATNDYDAANDQTTKQPTRPRARRPKRPLPRNKRQSLFLPRRRTTLKAHSSSPGTNSRTTSAPSGTSARSSSGSSSASAPASITGVVAVTAKRKSNAGAIAGGVVGGLIALLACVGAGFSSGDGVGAYPAGVKLQVQVQVQMHMRFRPRGLAVAEEQAAQSEGPRRKAKAEGWDVGVNERRVCLGDKEEDKEQVAIWMPSAYRKPVIPPCPFPSRSRNNAVYRHLRVSLGHTAYGERIQRIYVGALAYIARLHGEVYETSVEVHLHGERRKDARGIAAPLLVRASERDADHRHMWCWCGCRASTRDAFAFSARRRSSNPGDTSKGKSLQQTAKEPRGGREDERLDGEVENNDRPAKEEEAIAIGADQVFMAQRGVDVGVSPKWTGRVAALHALQSTIRVIYCGWKRTNTTQNPSNDARTIRMRGCSRTCKAGRRTRAMKSMLDPISVEKIVAQKSIPDTLP
ncbi:hypothetical protein B0H13DRAFT_1878284 [Mycena leptocephala]|nr:hypothetical protein B0H13DRAFT_1878284 [Mycena leptocephala]